MAVSSEASSENVRLAVAEGLLTSLKDTAVNPTLALGAARELLYGKRDRRELTRAQALDALEAFAKPLRSVELEEGVFNRVLHPHDRKGRWAKTYTKLKPATKFLGELKHETALDRWAKLDRDLLPYAGNPDHPEARRIIERAAGHPAGDPPDVA